MKFVRKIRSWIINRVLEVTTWGGIGLVLVSVAVIMDSSFILAALAAACGAISIIGRENK